MDCILLHILRVGLEMDRRNPSHVAFHSWLDRAGLGFPRGTSTLIELTG